MSIVCKECSKLYSKETNSSLVPIDESILVVSAKCDICGVTYLHEDLIYTNEKSNRIRSLLNKKEEVMYVSKVDIQKKQNEIVDKLFYDEEVPCAEECYSLIMDYRDYARAKRKESPEVIKSIEHSIENDMSLFAYEDQVCDILDWSVGKFVGLEQFDQAWVYCKDFPYKKDLTDKLEGFKFGHKEARAGGRLFFNNNTISYFRSDNPFRDKYNVIFIVGANHEDINKYREMYYPMAKTIVFIMDD